MNSHEMQAYFLGMIAYQEALTWQKKLNNARFDEQISDSLLFLEHYPVITIGKRGSISDVLQRHTCIERNIVIVSIDRGGQVTYHGPGQLVIYFIIHLYKRALYIHEFIQQLEQCIIQFLALHGISARHDEEYTGIWVDDKKIAALGVSIHKRVTMHGIALNITTDLSAYQLIVPCGIRHKGVTSMEQLGVHVSMQTATEQLYTICGNILGYDVMHLYDFKQFQKNCAIIM